MVIIVIECLVGLYMTKGKEYIVVWVLVVYNALFLLLGFLTSIFLEDIHYRFLILALLCLLIPRYVLKHGEAINARIVSKLNDLASEIEE